jgi:tRNA U34 2-thiouridine synthase MnmA/TrmU
VKAVGLLSGGLDSTLALKLVLEQGIEVVAFNMVTAFCNCTPRDASCSAARTAVRQLGIDLKVVNATEEYLPIVENPKHGHGSGMNPCLDCRILMFGKAKEYMEEIGASFIVTGEVLGQRPMSQRRDAMRVIERESGLDGYIVRPLCAGVMKPTVPEREGWIDREKLLSITGRGRKEQISLAEELEVYDYPCPAGGCLLTDKVFSERVRDLIRHKGGLEIEDVRLLKAGRHFRLSPRAKAAVGRTEAENALLEQRILPTDRVLKLVDIEGPLTVVRGDPSTADLELAASIAVRYSKARTESLAGVVCRDGTGNVLHELTVAAIDDEVLAPMRIGGVT